MNDKNLVVPSSSEARENGRKGGKKSGEVRRRKAAMKTVMKQLLSLPVQDTDTRNALSAMGIDPEQMDNQTALLASVLVKGIKTGDFRAMQAIAALTGEDNDAELLKLKKQEIKLKEQRQESGETDGEITALIEGLKDDIHG